MYYYTMSGHSIVPYKNLFEGEIIKESTSWMKFNSEKTILIFKTKKKVQKYSYLCPITCQWKMRCRRRYKAPPPRERDTPSLYVKAALSVLVWMSCLSSAKLHFICHGYLHNVSLYKLYSILPYISSVFYEYVKYELRWIAFISSC